MIRVRLTYAKTEELRYTSNLDVHRVWERALRRARLPLAYSQGFNPQPRINQACPLPLGITSLCEIIEAWFEEELPLEQIVNDLTPALPSGFKLLGVTPIDLQAARVQTLVESSTYLTLLLDPADTEDLRQRAQHLLDAPSLPMNRRGKDYDLRPLIESLRVENGPDGKTQILMRLSAREGATGRPEEVLKALGLDPSLARQERVQLHLKEE
jgi:radical SAM-linked protein